MSDSPPAIAVVLLLALLVLAGLPIAPAGGQQQPSFLSVGAIEIIGDDPKWVHGEATDTRLRVTVENSGPQTSTAYRLDYEWVKNGQASPLRGSEHGSFDAGGVSVRQHEVPWELQPGHHGDGQVRVTLTEYPSRTDERRLDVSIPVRQMELTTEPGNQTLRPDETRFLRVHIENQGNVEETVALRLAEEQPENASRTAADLEHDELTVPPGRSTATNLFVQFRFSDGSGDASPFTTHLELEATTAYGYLLNATTPKFHGDTQTPLPPGSPMGLERVGQGPLVVPRDDALKVPVRLMNQGTASDVYHIKAKAASGWEVTPGLERAGLRGGETALFEVTLEPPQNVPMGEPTELTVHVRSDREPEAVQWEWPVRVEGPAVRLQKAPDWTDRVYLDDPVDIAIAIHNDGSEPTPANATTTAVITGPEGEPRTVSTTAPEVAPGRTQILRFTAGNYTHAGPVVFDVSWAPGDDWTGPPIETRGFGHDLFVREPAAGLQAPAPLDGAPGELVGYRSPGHLFQVENQGNFEEVFVVEATAEKGQALIVLDKTKFPLAPGQSRSIPVDHRLPLPSGQAMEARMELKISIDTRSDLSWTNHVTTAIVDDEPPWFGPLELPALRALGEPFAVGVTVTDDSAVTGATLTRKDPNGNRNQHALSRQDGSDRWQTTLRIDQPGNHTFSFTASDAHGNEASSRVAVVEFADVPPPRLELAGPMNGETVPFDAQFDIHVDDELPIARVTVRVLDTDNRTQWEKNLTLHDGWADFHLEGTSPGDAFVHVEAVNEAGSRSNTTRHVIVQAPPAEQRDDGAIDDETTFLPAPGGVIALLLLLAALQPWRPGTGEHRTGRYNRRPKEAGHATKRTPKASWVPSAQRTKPDDRLDAVQPPRAKDRRGVKISRIHAYCLLAAFLVLSGGLPVIHGSDDTSSVDTVELEWWQSTDIGKGFHLRVPVTVENHLDHPVENGVVLAEVDIRERLIAAGWVKQPRAGTDLLRAFELDEASIRVVPMHNLEPMAFGSIDGRMKPHSTSLDPPQRFEVPSTHFAGSLTAEGDAGFHPRTNPMVTVLWRVYETLEPGEKRDYVVYFDSLTNIGHPPRNYAGAPGAPLLERTFWSGPGVDLLGLVRPPAGQPGTATVIGLHPETAVTVQTAPDGRNFVQQASQSTHTNPFILDEGEFKTIFISNTQGTPFRLTADKPILALVDSEGFVPTPAGRIIAERGEQMFFATTYRAEAQQDSLFFYNLAPGDPPAPTVVELHSTSDGTVQEIHLSDGVNQFPYTLGSRSSGEPRADGGQCVFDPTPEGPRIPPGPNTYRAVVTQGGPVALQLQPVRGLTQVPAIDQAPMGTDFWSVLSRSTATLQGGQCIAGVQQYNVYTIAPKTVELELVSPESPPGQRVFPSCTGDCGAGHPIGPPPGETLEGETFQTDGLFDRPLNFKTSGPGWLFVAPPPRVDSLADVTMRGPLGGAEAGRWFAGIGDTDLFAPFANTAVRAEIHYSATGRSEVPLRLVQGQLTSLPERPGERVLWYTLESDRPIIALPRAMSPGFLAGVPATLHATVHEADYRGYLVEIRSTTGLNPVSGSTMPGEPIEYSFVVTNLGRGAGATDLPDTVELRTSSLPDGWKAELSRSSIPLSTGERRTIHMTVTPAEDADPGMVGAISVQAVSRGHRTITGNELVTHAADTVTHIRSSFGVGVWFECAGLGCPKTLTRLTEAGETVRFPVVVQNTGSVADTISLDVEPPDAGWEVILLDEAGMEADQVALSAREQAKFTLEVTPPEDITEGILFTTITAGSTSSPAVLDRAVATARVQAPSDLVLTLDSPIAWAEPGEDAAFGLELHNEGDGTTEVFFEILHDDLPGWGEAEISMPLPHTGERVRLERLTMGPGDLLPLVVNVTTSSNATAGERMTLRLHVGTATPGEGREAFLYAIVEPVHRLDVRTPDLPLHVLRGGVSVPVEFRLVNDGNLDERLSPVVVSMPPGWDFTFPSDEVFVPMNATQVVESEVTIPEDVAEGEHALIIGFRSAEGELTEIPMPVVVGAFSEQRIEGPGVLPGQPGLPLSGTFTVHNTGNVPVEVWIEASEEETWELSTTVDRTSLAPGADAELDVGWQVPRDANDGESTRSAVLVAEPIQVDVATQRHPLAASVEIGRADLSVAQATAYEGTAGQIVRALVSNEGVRSAFGVEVVLRVDGVDVDRSVLAELPTGDQRSLTLLWAEGHKGTASIVINPDNTIVESNRGNNIYTLESNLEEREGVPGPGAPFLVIVITSAAAGLLSSRPDRTRGERRLVGPVRHEKRTETTTRTGAASAVPPHGRRRRDL